MPAPPSTLGLLKQTGREVLDDNCMSMSAAIAYYTLLSLPPLLAILVGVAGAVFGADAVQEQLTGQIGGLVGERGASEVRTMIENAGDLGGGSLLGQVLGLLALVFGATGAFVQLQQSLNRAWEIQPDPAEGGVKNFVTKRLLSFGMVLTIGFLLVVSLAASAVLTAFLGVVEGALGAAGALLARVGEILLSLGIFTLLFAAIFRVLPDAEVSWRDVWAGAFATAILFVVGKFVIGLYLGHSNPGEAFGAAGSIVVIMVWIYYTALILLAGAEFTQVWARYYGSRIDPDEDAVRVVKHEQHVRTPDALEVTGEEVAAQPEATHEQGKPARPFTEPRPPAPRSGWNPEPPVSEE